MSRRRAAVKRDILPDPKYHDKDLAKFINIMMLNGKKSVAEKIVYGALEQLVEKTKLEGMDAFNKALENIKPFVEVKSRRVGGCFSRIYMGHNTDIAVFIYWSYSCHLNYHL